MASQTSSQGTVEGLSPAQLLDDMTFFQLQRSQQLTGNPIKEYFSHALYNFLIIDPGAQASAKFGEERLKQSLEGCRDGGGYLLLPSLQQAFDSDFLDDTAVYFLGKAGRAPKPGPALHPDDAAKAIFKNVYAVQLSISEAVILPARTAMARRQITRVLGSG
ncbi:hypothetical protein KC316_g11546 [Hortaea werneckii]|nr:hypothetical protein KC324_g11439 [Hortaea werneckii]KAI7574299.1 hypothetical protein KC316_g11546 [Hortaea werneckii]